MEKGLFQMLISCSEKHLLMFFVCLGFFVVVGLLCFFFCCTSLISALTDLRDDKVFSNVYLHKG